jgi:hypothetical protein
MKTIFTLFTLLYFSLNSFAQDEYFASFTALIYDENGKKVKNASIKIYKENEVLVDAQTKKNGKVTFEIALGAYYTLEISKDGYITKRIAIKAYDKYAKPIYDALPFKFATELIKLKKNVNLDDLEFPVAILEYDASKDEFEFVRSYTQQMKAVQKEIVKQMDEQNFAASDDYVE